MLRKVFFIFQIGAFFMINLCLVVIATQFSETKKRETERMLQERKRYHSSSTLASISEPGGCYDEIIKYLAHLARKGRRKFNRYFRPAQSRKQRKVTPERAISLRRKRKKRTTPQYMYSSSHHPHQHQQQSCFISSSFSNPESTSSPVAPRASPEVSDIDPMSSPRRPNQLSVPGDTSGNPSTESLYYPEGAMLSPPDIQNSSKVPPCGILTNNNKPLTPAASQSPGVAAVTQTSSAVSGTPPSTVAAAPGSGERPVGTGVQLSRTSSFNSGNSVKNGACSSPDVLVLPGSRQPGTLAYPALAASDYPDSHLLHPNGEGTGGWLTDMCRIRQD